MHVQPARATAVPRAPVRPLLDRIDLRVDLPPVTRAAWLDGLGQPETTATARLAATFLYGQRRACRELARRGGNSVHSTSPGTPQSWWNRRLLKAFCRRGRTDGRQRASTGTIQSGLPGMFLRVPDSRRGLGVLAAGVRPDQSGRHRRQRFSALNAAPEPAAGKRCAPARRTAIAAPGEAGPTMVRQGRDERLTASATALVPRADWTRLGRV